MVRGVVFHNNKRISDLCLGYAGRTNVFSNQFQLGPVLRDYEVLSILVTATQTETANLGTHRITIKLTP